MKTYPSAGSESRGRDKQGICCKASTGGQKWNSLKTLTKPRISQRFLACSEHAGVRLLWLHYLTRSFSYSCEANISPILHVAKQRTRQGAGAPSCTLSLGVHGSGSSVTLSGEGHHSLLTCFRCSPPQESASCNNHEDRSSPPTV